MPKAGWRQTEEGVGTPGRVEESADPTLIPKLCPPLPHLSSSSLCVYEVPKEPSLVPNNVTKKTGFQLHTDQFI